MGKIILNNVFELDEINNTNFDEDGQSDIGLSLFAKEDEYDLKQSKKNFALEIGIKNTKILFFQWIENNLGKFFKIWKKRKC